MAKSSVSAVAGNHTVYWYGADAEIVDLIVGDLVAVLHGDATAFVIATADHLQHCRSGLLAAGIDVDACTRGGKLVMLDAQHAADWLCADGRPDLAVFEAITSPIRIAAAMGQPAWAYGEIVGVLWQRGDVAAALQVEEFWNDFISEVPLTLVCGYPQQASGDDDDAVSRVCSAHTAVRPRVPSSDGADVTRWFAGNAHAPRAARQFAARTLRQWGRADLIDECLLVVSELASNAVLHASSDFSLSLRLLPDGVEVVVGDTSAHVPAYEQPELTSTHGRGLPLIDGSSRRWGHLPVPGGKLVWARIVRRSG